MSCACAYIQAVMDGLAGSGGGGGGGGGIMQSEVTPEDEEAISRLMAMGVSRGAAIQALLVTMQCASYRHNAQCVHRGASNAWPSRNSLACETA